MVVASSGNSGPSAYITSEPAVARRVISVGAVDATSFLPGGVIIDVPGSASDVGGYNMYGSKVPVTGPLHVLYDGKNVSDGCAAGDWKPVARSDVVVIVRGNCDFSYKRHEAQSHGAVGVVLINNVPMTTLNPVPDPADHIPMISVNPSNQSELIAADGEKATLHTGNVANEFHGSMAAFSSAGPARFSDAIKPDVSAPGVSVNSTDGSTVDKGKLLTGTSMASPQVAGAAALILQANPSWSPQHVKGALVGTASTAKVSPDDPRVAGSGIIDVKKAINTDSWADSSDEQGASSITFGYQPIDLNTGGPTALSVTRGIRLSNSSSHATTYKLSDDVNGNMMGATLSMQSTVTVPAKSSRDVNVTISMSNSAAARLPSMAPGDLSPVATSAQGWWYSALVDIAGAVVFTPTGSGAGSYPVRVPWILVPRGTSEVQAWRPRPYSGTTIRTATVHVKNKGVHQGNVNVFAWGLSDQNENLGGIDLRAGGVQSLPTEACNGTPDPSNRCLVFAINTWHPWNSGVDNEYDVDIDLNGDGKPEYAVVGVDYWSAFGPSATQLPISLVLDLRHGVRIVDVWYSTAAPNSSTILLPVLASEIGRSAAQSTFRYWAESYSRDGFNSDVMFSGDSGSGGINREALFDAFHNAVSNGNFLPLNPGGSGDIDVSVNTAKYRPEQFSQKGWMFVNLEGPDGASQAELIPAANVT